MRVPSADESLLPIPLRVPNNDCIRDGMRAFQTWGTPASLMQDGAPARNELSREVGKATGGRVIEWLDFGSCSEGKLDRNGREWIYVSTRICVRGRLLCLFQDLPANGSN